MVLVLFTLLPTLPASAHQQPAPEGSSIAGWGGGDQVGYCGVNGTSSYSREVQAIAWADDDYFFRNGNSVSNIDGTWGDDSQTALMVYQGSHHLTADGCAGYDTLVSMQSYLQRTNLCSNGYFSIYAYRWHSGYPQFVAFQGVSPSYNGETVVNTFGDWRTVDHYDPGPQGVNNCPY